MKCNERFRECPSVPTSTGLFDNPRRQFPLYLFNWYFFATFEFFEPLAHRSNEIDLARNLVKRSVSGQAVKEIEHDLLVSHSTLILPFFRVDFNEKPGYGPNNSLTSASAA